MAELLLLIVDKTSSDVYKDCSFLKRGDVVDVLPDGARWGLMPMTQPHNRILCAPHLSLSAARTLCVPEAETDPRSPSRTLQARQFTLDLEHASWPEGFAAWLADDRRVRPTLTVPLSDEGLAAVKRRKAPVPDPFVFGALPSVVG